MPGFHYPTIKFLGNDEAHAQGYLLLRCFETGPGTGVSLVYSLDDQLTYIRKLIKPTHHYFPGLPAEVRYSNLADEKPFPIVPFFPRVVEQFELNDDSWITYTVAYNGGTHRQLLDKFSSQKKAIPESFIWHYIEQCVRAYAYLHCGIIEGKRVGGKEWVPIVHRDGNEDNIIFHFPDPDDLRARSEKNKKKAEAFPQVILIDLGMANRVKDPEEVRTEGKFDTPGVNEWEDIILFGERICELLYTSFEDPPQLRDESLRDLYSEELIAAVERFERPPNVVWGVDNVDQLPSWNWVFRQLLPTAFGKLREYLNQPENLESMLWARPIQITNMPYHVTPNDKDGLRALRKQGDYWQAVDFHFNTSEVTDLDELPDCLDVDFDLRSAPRVPSLFDFFEVVRDAAKRLKRAANAREKEHLSYGGTSVQWMNDIKAVRGILPILNQVYKDPDDPDADSSSSEEGTSVDDSTDGDTSGDDSSAASPSGKLVGGPTPSDHSGHCSARHSKSPSSMTASSAGASSAGGTGAKVTRKRGRSYSTEPSTPGKRRKTSSLRRQVRETIVKNTYITRTRDLDENGM
ncbi:hypothetical protein MMC17_004831 [Xylographa soralifera]|nr:hypothetical protein [Xylographa soralifera]